VGLFGLRFVFRFCGNQMKFSVAAFATAKCRY